MKKSELSNFQICTYIEYFKQEKDDQINCMLTLHDGRFAVGSKNLKIYNNIFFTIDFIVPSKKLKNSPTKKSDDSFFWISILIYLKNENILIRTNANIIIIKILNKQKICNFIQFFRPSTIFWITRIQELSNNSIITIGVDYCIEFFSKNENDEYYTSKVIKNAHQRDGYKTLIEIPNNKIISFGGSKLREFKVWDLNTYNCIYKGYINFMNYRIISLMLNKYVLVECENGLNMIDLNNNYSMHLVLKNDYNFEEMIKLNEKEFLITNSNNMIMKIKFNENKLKFEVIESYEILSEKKYSLYMPLIKINNNYFIIQFYKKDKNKCLFDPILLVFQYLNNF